MTVFWQFAKLMLRDRGKLTLAVIFAVISAGGLGVGLLSVGPMLAIVLEPPDAAAGEAGQSLQSLAMQHNVEGAWVTVPDWIVQQLPTDPFGSVLALVVAMAILTVLGGTANFLHQYLSLTIVTKTIALIRLDAFHHVINLPLGRVIERGPSEFIARIIRDSAELQRGFIALTSKAMAQVTKGLAAFVVALIVAPGLTLLFVIVAPFVAFVLRKLGKRIRRGTRGALLAQESLLRISTEALQGLRAVKANTAELKVARRFHVSNKEVIHQELRARTARALSGPLVEMLAIFAIGGLAIVAAKQILGGDLGLERFILAAGALAVAGSSFKPLAGLVNEMQAASAPAERLRDMLAEPHESAVGYRRPSIKPHRESIEFDNVSLTYPRADRPALNGVTLRFGHGERVAIVGANGSGKTTLLSLLPRLLMPDSGRVLIDGIDIATVSIRSLRNQIAVVTQDTVLFRGTIAENIGFGVEGKSRSEIVAAAHRAHADQFILNIPSGYDADVLEQGASLSGGQRQRLAIARAILREPAILILDEATSQIDAESEAHINQALAEFCVGRTSLIIAHRLSTVLGSDRIVVMHEGGIVDHGTHDELLERCEHYRRLMHTQLGKGDDADSTAETPRLRIAPSADAKERDRSNRHRGG